MASATEGVKNFPRNGCGVDHVIALQILIPLIFLEGWDGGGGGKRGVRATTLCRIPSLFLNDALIYSQDAVSTLARRGRYVTLCITLLLLFIKRLTLR